MQAVVYDFPISRAGEHARAFLGTWQGKLVCDNSGSYKAGFNKGIVEINCMVHARRKFCDLHVANQSQIAQQALKFFGQLYDFELEAANMTPQQWGAVRKESAKPMADALHA